MDEKTKQALAAILGEDNFSDKLIDLIAFSTDASEHSHRPEAACWPQNTEQVSAVMKLANEKLFPVIPRGAGTSLAGLTVPEKGGLVMDLGQMNKIVKISVEDRLVIVQPGVVYADLEKAIAPKGFFFPPDPASGKVATLGGNVATNAGGIKGAKYGTTKDYVLSLEVVLADGRILRTGSNCIKSVSGYDLTRLFVGSEGTLGVITEITFKINPKPPISATAMATFENIEDAGRAVSQVITSGVVPSVMEVVDRNTIKAINGNTDLNLPQVAAILLAETDGFTHAETDHQMTKVVEIFKENNASSVKQAKDAQEAEALWTARKSAYGVMTRLNNNLVVEDMSVPMSHLAEIMRFIEDLAEKRGLLIATVGHVGDGNLHPCICYDGTDKEETANVHAASGELFEKVIALGGTLTGEHGIGLAKAPYMELEHSPVSMAVQRALKNFFDPNNILNPGKMALEG